MEINSIRNQFPVPKSKKKAGSVHSKDKKKASPEGRPFQIKEISVLYSMIILRVTVWSPAITV